MPKIKELASIVNYNVPYPGPTVFTAYFPNTVSSFYWPGRLSREAPAPKRHGLPLFPVQPKAGVVTLELVNQLRDETP